MKRFWLLGLVLLSYGCSPTNQLPPQASKVVDTAVESAGSDKQPSSESQPVTFRDSASSNSDNQPPAWISIGVFDQGNHLDVDTQSIRPIKPFITYRSRILFANPQNGVAIAVNQQVMDCRSGVYQIIEAVTLTNRGQVIEHQTQALPPEQTEIGTLQDQLHNIVCNGGTVANDPSPNQQMRLEAHQNQYRTAEKTLDHYAKMHEIGAQVLMNAASQRYDSTPTPKVYPCDYPWQQDDMGRLCGDRAASERPGGREP